MAETPDGTKLYVANQGDGTISAFNTKDRSARQICVNGTCPVGSALLPLSSPPIWISARTDSERVYVLEARWHACLHRHIDDGRPRSVGATLILQSYQAPGSNYMWYDVILNRLYIPGGDELVIVGHFATGSTGSGHFRRHNCGDCHCSAQFAPVFRSLFRDPNGPAFGDVGYLASRWQQSLCRFVLFGRCWKRLSASHRDQHHQQHNRDFDSRPWGSGRDHRGNLLCSGLHQHAGRDPGPPAAVSAGIWRLPAIARAPIFRVAMAAMSVSSTPRPTRMRRVPTRRPARAAQFRPAPKTRRRIRSSCSPGHRTCVETCA